MKPKLLWETAVLTIGCVLYSMAFSFFLEPAEISPGGISGLAMVLNELISGHFNIKIGTLIFILNFPLILLGLKKIGKKFILLTIYATALLSWLINLLSLINFSTGDMLLNAVCGGALMGIGLGMAFIGGGSTGGTDIISRLVKQRFSQLKIGAVLLYIDCIIVTISAFVFQNILLALYAAIALYISSKAIDKIIYKFHKVLLVYIISDKYADISKKILKDLGRGVTCLNAKGAYTENNKTVLLCAVKRADLNELTAIVNNEDISAFMIISDANRVSGTGFSDDDALL